METKVGSFNVSDEEIATLMSGSAKHTDRTVRERAQMRFEDNAESIAIGLIEIAMDKRVAPAVRVKAATYCIDRVMGPTSTATRNDEVNDVLMGMVKEFTKAE